MDRLTALIAQNPEAGRRACKEYFEPGASSLTTFVLENALLDDEDIETYVFNVASYGNEKAAINIASQVPADRKDLLDEMFQIACSQKNSPVALILVEQFGVVPPDDGHAICYAAKFCKRLLFLLFRIGLQKVDTNERWALTESFAYFEDTAANLIVEVMMQQGHTKQEIADRISIHSLMNAISTAFPWCLSIGAFQNNPNYCMRVLCEWSAWVELHLFMKNRRVPLNMHCWKLLSQTRPELADVAISLGLADWRACYTAPRVYQSMIAGMDTLRSRFLLGRPFSLPKDLRQQMLCLLACFRRKGLRLPESVILEWAVVCYTRWLHHHSLIPYEAVRPSLRCTACNFKIVGL